MSRPRPAPRPHDRRHRRPHARDGATADDAATRPWDAEAASPELSVGAGRDDAAGEDERPDEADVDRRIWPPKPTVPLDEVRALELLRSGELEIVGRLVVSSNNAMVGTISLEPAVGPTIVSPCVYKPVLGERPLWDFPDGTLAAREAAAYVLSEAGGWAIVPPTVVRDGPFGEGMVQLWLEPDPSLDAVAMVVEGDERLRPIALFDAVANNADRKIGHLLPMTDGRVFGVDHGICFHVEPKLRTVLWQWRGTRIRDGELETLRRLRSELDGELGRSLAGLLSADEVRALATRLHHLLVDGCFPHPDPDRPAIPWPPY